MRQGFLMGFLKNVFWLQQLILGLGIVCPCNFGSTLEIFFKFCPEKWAKSYMEIILMVFKRKFTFRANGLFFGLKMVCPHNSGSTVTIFLTFCIMREVKRDT